MTLIIDVCGIKTFRRYRREFEALDNYSQALRSTLATVGRPITFTTMTLILGFMVMTLSDLSGWSHFGFLAGWEDEQACNRNMDFRPFALSMLGRSS